MASQPAYNPSAPGPKPAAVPPAAGPVPADSNKVVEKSYTTVHTEVKSGAAKTPAKKHRGPTDEEKKQLLKIAGAAAAAITAVALGVAGYKACKNKDDNKKEKAERKVDEGKNWLGQKASDAKQSAHNTKEAAKDKAAKLEAKLEDTAAAKKLQEAKEKADKQKIELEKKSLKASGEYDDKLKHGYVKAAEKAGNAKDAVDRNPVVKEWQTLNALQGGAVHLCAAKHKGHEAKHKGHEAKEDTRGILDKLFNRNPPPKSKSQLLGAGGTAE
ncbi:hypothetical protein WJX72_001634 [[Myrmecia] bisecta]|uniref:Late embryogenesis abundant protein n=1 Tax=[Myrmecia] bisecta TaxID=41462 RepID=A0AAW1Q157_9CHLO